MALKELRAGGAGRCSSHQPAKGARRRAAVLPACRTPAFDLAPELTDLADTAAVLRCLDLVVTVDTALGHLAGALGTPVWVALPVVPDWRWVWEREDSPWYPSMRLFRQTVRGQWKDVFGRIRMALASRMNRDQEMSSLSAR